MLIGSNGQLGSDIARVLIEKPGAEVIPLTRMELDVTSFDSISRVVKNNNPDVVINTAAYHQVDVCEDKPELAFATNTYAQKNLCAICKEIDARYVFFSTDYVFDGYANASYMEEDTPSPINIYGISKLAGEQIIQYMLEKYFIIRVSGLYGATPPSGKKYNFVDLMIDKAQKGDSIEVVNDQRLTPTSTLDIANKLYEILNKAKYGIYHLTNTGNCTWFEFAQEIFTITGLKHNLEPCKTGTFGEKAKRPSFSVLENKHLKDLGIEDLQHWKNALTNYIKLKYPQFVSEFHH